MSLASRVPRLSFLGRRGLDLAEIEALLDLFSHAAILVDLQLNRILLANAKATELTAFTRADFADMALSALFPHLNPDDFSLDPHQVQKSLSGSCLAHNGNQLEVIITLYPLNARGSWLLASLEPAVFTSCSNPSASVTHSAWRICKPWRRPARSRISTGPWRLPCRAVTN